MGVFLDKYKIKEEEEEFSFLNKYKFTPTEPTQFGIGAKAVGGATLPEPEPTTIPLSQTGFKSRMRGIGEAPEEYSLESVKTDFDEASRRSGQLWWKEFQTTDDKWKFLKQENWSPELRQADIEAQRLSQEASKLGVNTGDWIRYGVHVAFFAGLAAQVLPLVSKLPANIMNNIAYKVEGKTVKGQALKDVLKRVAYPETGKPSLFDRKVFDEFTKRGGLKGIGGSLKEGIKITETVPRFAFGGKLYAGLPADEIAKSIVEVGKVSAEAVKGLDPVKVSQVTQQLLNTAPALASEFLKAVEKPKEPVEIPKVEIKIGDFVRDEDNLIRGIVKGEGKIDKNIPAYKIDIGGGRISAIPKSQAKLMPYTGEEPTPLKKVEKLVVKEEISKVKPKIQQEIKVAEEKLVKVNKEIEDITLKITPKQPKKVQLGVLNQQKIKIEKEIEVLKAEPIPPTKPQLPPEKAVPPAEKAKVEPTPKAIPAELEGLAEEARKYKKPTYYVKSPTREGGIYYTIGDEKALQERLDKLENYRKLYLTKFKFTDESFDKWKSDKIKEIGVYGAKKPTVKTTPKEIPEINYSLEEDVIKEYGETDIPERGAFITSDGRFIDGGGTRYTDHREMVPDDLQDYMNKTQNVRIVNAGTKDAENQANIDIVYRPTDEQIEAIKQLVEGKIIYADVSGFDGSKIASGEFDNFNDWLRWVKSKTHSPDFYNQATAKPTTEQEAVVEAGEGEVTFNRTKSAIPSLSELSDATKIKGRGGTRLLRAKQTRLKKMEDELFEKDKKIFEKYKNLSIPELQKKLQDLIKFADDRDTSRSRDTVIIPDIIRQKQQAKPTTPPVAEKATPAPAKAEVTPTPKPEVKVEPEMATPTQIKKAHAIANSKAMISEKGKVKPQYRKVAEAMTGKTSIKDMTPEEAEVFIDALNRLPEPKYRDGKLVPPSIPRTTKLTTQDFFKKKYGEPTPVWLLTDQTYYAEKLGVKPLVASFEIGKQEFDLEFRKSSNLVDRMVNKLNKIAKTPGLEKVKSKVKNIPTKAESKMAGLLNKHEATPPGLSQKEEDVFKYFRNLSKDIWRRENEVREKLDLLPIKYKTAYFRHTADAMAKEMMEGKYPFPEGIKYWSGKTVGKKIFNPMEFQRKLSDDLIDLWSKDIRAVTKAMLWNGLKEIHLAEPAKYFKEQLNAISKDLPEYKNLSPREQKAYDQTEVIPASTKKWLIDYINQVLKGQETELDASLNRIVTKSGLKGIFDKVLTPFGRTIGRKPITNLFSLSGRMIISGVMGWVPRQIIRNVFQQVQNLALYGVKATLKSLLPASIDKNLKGLLTESLFMKSYTGFEELPTNLMGKLEKVWLGPYGMVAVNNAKQGMKAAYWNISELIKNPKFKKYGWADPQRTKTTPKGFLYPSEKEKLLKEMEFGSSCTQYQYIPLGMPGVFRYKALIPLTRLQSWWMNYFTKFNREAIHRGFKGRPSWSGEDGPTLPWSRRVNWLKYLVIGGAILTALGYRRSFMLGVLPVYISPAGQVALGIYNYATANTDWQKKRALNQIYYSWKAFIPGSLAWRDFLAVWNGEKDLEEILFYGKKEEKKVVKPTSPYLNKYKEETTTTSTNTYLNKYKK